MVCESQDEFVKRLTALPKHARDQHELCDFHPQLVYACGKWEGSTDTV